MMAATTESASSQGRPRRRRGDDDGAIQSHLQLACPDAEPVLDEERQDIEAELALWRNMMSNPMPIRITADERRVDGLDLAYLQHGVG